MRNNYAQIKSEVISNNLSNLKEILMNMNDNVYIIDEKIKKTYNNDENDILDVNKILKKLNVDIEMAINIIDKGQGNIDAFKSSEIFNKDLELFQSNINKNIIQLYEENRKFKEEVIKSYKTNNIIIKEEVVKAIEEIINNIDEKKVSNSNDDIDFDRELEFDDIITLAQKGNPIYQFMLGEKYFDGNNINKDYTEAVIWFEKAAIQGYTKAILYLGYCYGEGLGVKKNKKKMISYYKEAACQGNVDAQFILGECYFLGNGVIPRKREAVKWFTEAANKDDSEAQFTLAEFYRKGIGVDEDINKALKWYEKAAKKGHKKATEYLEEIYVNNI